MQQRGGGVPTLGSCYALACDVDATGWTDATIGSYAEGDFANAFTGHFDGGGHKIALPVDGSTDKRGLFAALDGATVKDLELEAVTSVRDTATGALVCYARNSAISQLSVTQVFQNNTGRTAGIAGVNDGSVIRNCETRTASAESVAFNGYGGICLYNKGEIADCQFYLGVHPATLTGFGGIAFENYGTIRRSDSHIVGENLQCGRLFGGIVSTVVRGTLDSCTAYLDFTAAAALDTAIGLGGMAGQICPALGTLDQTAGPVDMIDCTVTGGVFADGVQNVGGFIGGINASSTGAITIRRGIVDLKAIVSRSLIGGLIGHARIPTSLTIDGCVVNAEISGDSYSGGFIGMLNYAADSAALTLENSACYGASVTATSGCAGGFLGVLSNNTAEAGQGVTAVRNCLSYAAVNAWGSAGGAVGEFAVTESPSAEAKFKDCRIYGNVSADYRNAGGFFGKEISTNLTVKDCIANGAISCLFGDAYGTLVGGFVGESSGNAVYEQCSASGVVTGGDKTAGFAGAAYRTSFKNCRADGNVRGGYYFAGFVGHAVSVLAESCTATGNVVLSYPAAIGTMGGAFAGGVEEAGSFVGCDAYGTVTSKGFTGGFVGSVQAIGTGAYETGSLSGKAYFSKCRAYGRVCQDEGVSGIDYGGFVGYVNNQAGSVEFSACEAYGDAVTTSRAGGFVAESRAGGETVLYSKCKAYGNSRNTDSSANGAFAAWLVGSVIREEVLLVAHRVEYCETYGNSYNNVAPGSEAAGLVGVLECKAAIVNCHSHAAELVGTVAAPGVTGQIGGIVGRLETDITVCTITGNIYTRPGGVPAIGSHPDVVLDASNVVDAADYTGRNPRPDISCAIVKRGAGDIEISFTGVTGIAGYVSGFDISVDGGKTFTQLVYTSSDLTVSGMLLVPIAGAKDAAGRLLPQVFTYTFSNRGEYNEANVIVRIMFSDGFARIFTF